MALKVFLALLQLGFVVWVKWASSDAEKKQKVKDLKKEADDAVESKDIPRLHSLIERIGRL